ncbi:MAG: rhombosortase [Burkholderiales bacterium]
MVAPARSLTARLPLLTLAVCALALGLLFTPPDLQDLLQFDRERIAADELWRLVTCHVVHYSPSHAARDVLSFLVLGTLLERESRRWTGFALIAAAMAVAPVLWFAEPALEHYRGLSALGFALLGALCASAFIRGRREALVAGLALTVALGWIAVQWMAPSPVDTSAAAVYTPVASAHLTGLMAGLVAASLLWSRL